MARLEWFPQTAYAPYFYTDSNEIIKRRTVFREEFEYFVAYGGRGSAKTWTFADAVVVEGSIRKIRVLVTREIQLSIDESIKAEIEAAIENRGLEGFYRITKTEIIGRNGTKFVFKGLKNNIKSLKSISKIDIALCEEAESITQYSWDKFLPSIRPASGRPIVIVIFNPENELDDTYQRFVVNPQPRSIVIKINWDQNKYFPEHLNRQRLQFKKTRPKKDYEHHWEGMPTGSHDDIIIDLDWIKAARFASKHPDFKKVGIKKVGYDPAGQGRDYHAVCHQDGNIITHLEEWPISPDLRIATHKAFDGAIEFKAKEFRYDECGGFGDGVSVFVADRQEHYGGIGKKTEVRPFNAGDGVINPDEIIEGTDKTWGEMYANAKAQAHAITAQMLYTTYRFIELGERDMRPEDMLSIDIEDDTLFLKFARELSTPIWKRSVVNSKKRVESKKEMEDRTGQVSPNLADSAIMLNAPVEVNAEAGGFSW